MRRIKISDEALRDLDDGYEFYEVQEPGLGDYFVSCLRADIDSLYVYAGLHRPVYRDYHRLLSRVFPSGIFYTLETEMVTVWAVIDLRRDPEWIRQRLLG